MIPVFRATITKCRLDVHDQTRYVVYLAGLEGQQVEVTIKKPEKKRSLQENKYYWKIIIPILGDYFGYNDSEMHEAIKYRFLVDNSGKIPKIGSTKNLTTVEFEKLMTDIRQWAAQDWSVYIPLPNEIEY